VSTAVTLYVISFSVPIFTVISFPAVMPVTEAIVILKTQAVVAVLTVVAVLVATGCSAFISGTSLMFIQDTLFLIISPSHLFPLGSLYNSSMSVLMSLSKNRLSSDLYLLFITFFHFIIIHLVTYLLASSDKSITFQFFKVKYFIPLNRFKIPFSQFGFSIFLP
jgi:hypothetical protein